MAGFVDVSGGGYTDEELHIDDEVHLQIVSPESGKVLVDGYGSIKGKRKRPRKDRNGEELVYTAVIT